MIVFVRCATGRIATRGIWDIAISQITVFVENYLFDFKYYIHYNGIKESREGVKIVTVTDIIELKKYKPVINYIKGIANKFSSYYSHITYANPIDYDEIIQECYLKLLYLQRENKLEEIISGTVKEKGKIKYPLLGTVIKNHLINYVRNWKNESCFGSASLDEAEEINPDTGKPKNIKNTRINYIKPKKVKKLEGRPYIPTKTLNAPRLLLGGYKIGKSVIICLDKGFINIGTESFENDLLDKIILEDYSKKVLKSLEKIRNGKLRQKIFLCELLYGYVKPKHYKDIATVLNVKYTVYIKRNIKKIFDVKTDVMYELNKKIIEIDFKNDPYKLRELEHTYKAFKTGKTQAYWTGR